MTLSLLIIVVKSNFIDQKVKKSVGDNVCTITLEELQMMKLKIANSSGSVDDNSSNCGKLISETVDCTTQLKESVFLKTRNTENLYNETLESLINKENEFKENLNEVSEDVKEKYDGIIKELSEQIKNFYEDIEDLEIKRDEYEADINYFNEYLNNGTKFISRFDDDSFFESSSKCEISRTEVKKMITEFNEIFKTTTGESQMKFATDECFENIKHSIENIENMITHRTGEDRIKTLKLTFEERKKCYQKVYDNQNLQFEQDGEMNFSQISDDYEKIKLKLSKLQTKIDKMFKEKSIQGFKTVKKMIFEGTRMRKAAEIFVRIRSGFDDPYANLISRTYECKQKNLPYIMNFVAIYNKYEGYEIIRDNMVKCDQTDSPYILMVANVINGDAALKKNVDNVYDGWLDQLKQGKFDQIMEFLFKFDEDVVNLPRLIRKALEENVENFKRIMEFIDELHAYSQKIIVNVFDDMVDLKKVDTVQFLKLAVWIGERLKWVDQQDRYLAITGNIKPILENLRERLSESLKTFVFEPDMILSYKHDEMLLRSDTHIGVKFKTTKDKSGDFYLFEDVRYKKALCLERFQDSLSKTESMVVRLKSENKDNCYWSVIPVNNATNVLLKNKLSEHYLSKVEINVCVVTKVQKKWFTKDNIVCDSREWMNRAFSESNDETIRWELTQRLIRNRILPDRNQG